MYFYENHLGGIYYSEEALDYEYLYCEQCGDSDNELGYYENSEEAKKSLIDYLEWSDETIEYYESVIDEAFS